MDEAEYKKAVEDFFELFEMMKEAYNLSFRVQLFNEKESTLQIFRNEQCGKVMLLKVTDIDTINLWKRGKLSLERAERMILINGRVHTNHTIRMDGMERGYPEETGRDSW